MLDQVAGAPGPEGLLVGDRGQGQSPLEALANAMEENIGEDRSTCAGLHIAGAAPVDLAVDEFTTPGVLGPTRSLAHREHVDMAVQRQMLTWAPAVEGGDQVGHLLVG